MTSRETLALINIRRLPFLGFLLCIFCGVLIAKAEQPATQQTVKLVLFQRGFKDITDIAAVSDTPDRIYVAERGGLIKVLDISPANASSRATLGEDLLDIGEVFSAQSYVGLESIAFPPTFSTLHSFFITYTDKNGDTILASVKQPYDDDGELQTAGPDDMSVLLKIVQPRPEHPRSTIRFGPDGYLYMTSGSFDTPSKAQQQDSLRGGVLRLDVSDPKRYQIPQDNPSTGIPPQPHEMWATGIEEVWALTFDEATKPGLIGLSGKNSQANLYHLERARDYASHCSQKGCTPLLNLQQVNSAQKLVGALQYRGTTVAGLIGQTIIAEKNTGSLLSFARQGDKTTIPTPVTLLPERHIQALAASSRGEILVGTDQGEIFRLQESPAPQVP
jgi:hypothetical protein